MKKYNIALAMGLCLACNGAYANPITLNTGHVQINFDDAYGYDSEIVNWQGSTFQTDLPAFAGVGNALQLIPSISNSIGGSGYWEEGHLSVSMHDISFAAQSGYQITGYRISFSGVAEKYGAGSYDFQASGNGSVSMVGNRYNYSSLISGDAWNNFASATLSLSAPYIANDDGTASVFGLANGTIDRFSIEAITQPVPEPETYALLLAGLATMGMVARRRRKTMP